MISSSDRGALAETFAEPDASAAFPEESDMMEFRENAEVFPVLRVFLGLADADAFAAGAADDGAADTGIADAGDAGEGEADAGAADTGDADTGAADAGAAAVGAPDAGAADTGAADAECPAGENCCAAWPDIFAVMVLSFMRVSSIMKRGLTAVRYADSHCTVIFMAS